MNQFDNLSFDSLSAKEWIVTNGIGGYASSSLSGANTRRYHGLLVASFQPPTNRHVVVSKLEETITCDDLDFPISSNQYPGVIHPEGHKFIRSFERDPLPRWLFSSGPVTISKTIFMVYGANTTIIEYENTCNQKIHLQIVPLVVCRDYHHLRRESENFKLVTEENKNQRLKISSDSCGYPFYIFYEKGNFQPEDTWYRNFEYFREKERGLDYQEDAKAIGQIHFELLPGQKAHVILSTDEILPGEHPSSLKKYEALRLEALIPSIENKFLKDLIISGDQFLVWRLSSRSHTLIAGYHWFTDWGRDTMIAMRGLVIATGKKQMAESILLTFLNYLRDGLIPNRFPDSGEEPEYNTIDATLWLFIALYEYYEKFKDLNFIARVYPMLNTILETHYNGTRFNIHVTEEGLLYGGEKNIQLTWMDAKVNDHVVTPRQGCPVEINALWYNALNIYVEFGELLQDPISAYKERALNAGVSFRKYFYNDKGYLNDVINPGKWVNDDIRPNQVYAISLPFNPLTRDESKSVLATIEKHLYTDLGLRSLSPDHPEFKPVYTGDQWNRDHAYHQGTVWAFLWGEYALAYLSVNVYSPEAKKSIREKAKSLEHHFYHEDGIHAISEIFSGKNPGPGKGCIQQAWSIGMTIKALFEAEG